MNIIDNNVYLEFNVGKLRIERAGWERIPAGNRNFICAAFTFSPAWDGLDKTAVFRMDEVDFVVPIVDGLAVVPSPVMEKPGTVYVSVFADDLKTVNSVNVEVVESGYKPGSTKFVKSENITAVRGEDGHFQFETEDGWHEVSGGGKDGADGNSVKIILSTEDQALADSLEYPNDFIVVKRGEGS